MIWRKETGTGARADRERLWQASWKKGERKGNMKLLYAEDEPAMSEAVTDILTFHKYMVDAVDNGQDALEYARSEEYDGIILDIMMPRIDGLTVLKRLREEGNRTPVLLLTAKAEVADRIEGLDLGADDYLPKPFVMEELLARVRAILRRRESFMPAVLEAGDIRLDPSDATLRCGGKSVELQNREYQLMEALMKNPGIFQSADSLVISAWGYDAEADANSVRVYLSGLRKKLAELGSHTEIVSRRNIGYALSWK